MQTPVVEGDDGDEGLGVLDADGLVGVANGKSHGEIVAEGRRSRVVPAAVDGEVVEGVETGVLNVGLHARGDSEAYGEEDTDNCDDDYGRGDEQRPDFLLSVVGKAAIGTARHLCNTKRCFSSVEWSTEEQKR